MNTMVMAIEINLALVRRVDKDACLMIEQAQQEENGLLELGIVSNFQIFQLEDLLNAEIRYTQADRSVREWRQRWVAECVQDSENVLDIQHFLKAQEEFVKWANEWGNPIPERYWS